MSTEYENVPEGEGHERHRRSDQPYTSVLDLEEGGVEPDAAEVRTRAPRISQADVFQAADALLVAGHRPTIDRVRMRLGRGSPNTINDHLDAWWQRLGSRLRDLPGRQFPELPERVGLRLQSLWNEALEAAHDSLRTTLESREAALHEEQQALHSRRHQLDQEQAIAATRVQGLEETLGLVRTQLAEANLRARTLEETQQAHSATVSDLRSQLEQLRLENVALMQRLDTERAAATAERARLEERHTAAEARWLREVDHARQAAAATERNLRALNGELGQLSTAREDLRGQLLALRSDLKIAQAAREQLQARLQSPPPAARTATPRRKASSGSNGRRKRAAAPARAEPPVRPTRRPR